MGEYSPAKTGEYPRIFPNFQNCARCVKDLKDNKDNSLHLGRKYARIFVLGHYLFFVTQSFPRATLSENCSLLGTDNVLAYFRAKLRLLFIYYILLGKRHFFLQRSEFKPSSFDHFLEFVKDKLIVQRSIFYSKGQTAKFLSLWKPLLSMKLIEHLIYVCVKQAWLYFCNLQFCSERVVSDFVITKISVN